MLSGSVLISDAVFLELVDALNQYSEEEEEGHESAEGKQEAGKDELPVTRKRKRLSMESKWLSLFVCHANAITSQSSMHWPGRRTSAAVLSSVYPRLGGHVPLQ